MIQGWTNAVANIARAGFWLLLIGIVVSQIGGARGMAGARAAALQAMEQERQTRVIALVHRQDEFSLFGIPIGSALDVDDSEAVLRAIRLTPPDRPIDLVLHTPGGLALAAEQIASALAERKAKVTVFVPHYAMSGGTLIALAADEIVMDPNAVLGQVDPQINGMPAGSIVRAVDLKGPQGVSDEFLVLADVAEMARTQVGAFLVRILLKHLPTEEAIVVATLLSQGGTTHDFPITPDMVREFGLKVSTDVPAAVYGLMDLYPRTAASSVLYSSGRRVRDTGRAPGERPAAP
jgi:ClpP class serine protease